MKDENKLDDFYKIPYSDIIQIIDTMDTQNRNKKLKYQSKTPKRWDFKFEVACANRTYELLAPSEDECFLWVFTFNWIVSENRRLEQKNIEFK